MGELVKLYVYQHQPDETVIDTFTAKSWEDFIIIEVDMEDADALQAMSQAMVKYADEHPEKHVFLVGKASEVSFYGVRPEEDDAT